MINPTREHWKAMERTVGYILSEPYKGLVLKKPKNFKLIYTQMQIMHAMRTIAGVSLVKLVL